MPLVQFFGPSICGVIADKLGRSKPVLVGNLFLTILVVVCMLLAPSMNMPKCDTKPVRLLCHSDENNRLIAETDCENDSDVIKLSSCNITFVGNETEECDVQKHECDILEENEYISNLSLSIQGDSLCKMKNKCNHNITSVRYLNNSFPWCGGQHQKCCDITCLMNSEENCVQFSRTPYLVLNMFLLILFYGVMSNTYRFLDITSMCLAKEHNSDYGRERFFAIVGILTFSPLYGYLVDATTVADKERNYDAAFYLFIGFIFSVLCVLYKLDVTIQPPGKNMWRKTLHILKNPDNIAFIGVLLVLGMAWGFIKNLTPWYLEGMKADGFLLGLITSVNALYGLPFLFTSKWWVKKIGTTKIFILGLLGYVASAIGYSLLRDPWFALLIECTSIFTYHLLWVAVIVHSHDIAPEGLRATVISTAGGVHFSIGK